MTPSKVINDRTIIFLIVLSPRSDVRSTATGCLDGRDVDLFHLHHRIERTLGGGRIRIGYRLAQRDRRDLPGQSPLILAPTARTLFAAIADDGVPVTIRFRLVRSCDLKRERFAVLEHG